MQVKTFNRLVISTIAIAIVVPVFIWFVDSLSTQSGWFAHILGSLALMAIPVLWVIGNIITGIAALFNKPLVNKLFWAQCAVTALIFVGVLYWASGEQSSQHKADLHNNVVQAIKTQDISQYKQALSQCGEACVNGGTVQPVSIDIKQYDQYAYKDWLATAVAAQALAIVDDLLIDPHRPDVPLVHSGAPNLSLGYSCSGYYVGEANIYQIAVLQKTPTMLQRLIDSASIEEKSTALWYAAQANRIDYLQLLLAAGADRNIKDEYGVQGVENGGYTLVDAAVQGFAIETLQWLLDNGFTANGQLGKTPLGTDETPRLKHTPLHSVIYMAHQEQTQFKSLERSIKMWQMLKKVGADDTIAEPQSHGNPQTPLQRLLETNVFGYSADIVRAFVAQNISTQGLSAQQQAKLQTFLNTKSDRDNSYGGQLDPEYCAENWLRNNYDKRY
jgi:Ankyrin repeats (3 copies)